ncbi:SgcJ/EcaC family oxidoreductase [Microbacterium sp. zg-YB36]|uniref:SgcJ/EcaC family oxidoreductase n=1 Tax=Microbacterium sp. zg-YB36 TaxID=2969407 RepID=UPI00214B5E19|nr:SgcJ/EcaC family oxidoreductase [Microbacterium sp. zg-YB36]MDL5352442.1 SgcJ/EcaC family oxidoreductase [Microbacterium sp. zg-YB36]
MLADDAAASREKRALATMNALEHAWATGDAQAYGALHSPTATYVAFDGTVMTGSAEIAEGHRELFAGIMKGSRLLTVERTLRHVGADSVVVVQRAGIVMSWQRGRARPSRKRLSTNTTLLRELNGQWIVEGFQNTRYHPWARTLVGRIMTRRAK